MPKFIVVTEIGGTIRVVTKFNQESKIVTWSHDLERPALVFDSFESAAAVAYLHCGRLIRIA